VIMAVDLVLSNFILVVWRSSDYGVDLVLFNVIMVVWWSSDYGGTSCFV
jgi:hypothetical protein